MQKSDRLDEHFFQDQKKYFVVKPPFITHDYYLYKNILIQSMKFSPNPIFFKK